VGLRRRSVAVASIVAYLSVAVVASWELSTTRWDLAAQGGALADGRVHPQSVVLVAHLVCLVAWVVVAWRALGHLRRASAGAACHRRGDSEHPRGLSGTLAIACASVMPTLSAPASLAPSALPMATLVLPSVAVIEVRRSQRGMADDVADDVATTLPPAVRDVGGRRVTVRVYGHPEVVGPGGCRAVFRKSRSLELLVWLCLNRDRQRRSTARTAIWDADIGHASFATVVSEMRRGLAEVAPGSDPQSWCPSSYTDQMALSPLVVSDAELISETLSRFRDDPENTARDLAELVGGIRDMPFAGAGYLWPDVDGTTTRLMIVGLDAVTELADWAVARGRTQLALAAIAAGLRMMPGDAELLERQGSLLARRTSSDAPFVRRHRHGRTGRASLARPP